jgi:tape measure domain-containing protein
LAQANVKIAVDATSAVNKLRQVNTVSKRLSSTTDRLEQSVRRNNKRFRETGAAARTASAGVNRLGAAVRKLLIGFSLFKTASFVIFNTQQIESQRKSLEVLTGSLEDTNEIIAEIQAFGAVTPFKSSDLIETTKRLKAFGFETEELVDVTKRLADVAGATGADLGGIATAFGQIQAKGRLQGEELLQLQERGVSLQDELQKMYGFTADQFRKALEGGRISADAVNLALQRITDAGGKYANGAIAQSTTLAGKFSTLVDGVETLARTFGEVLDPVLKGVLNNAITVINTINKAINLGKIQTGLGLDKAARKRILDQAKIEAAEIVNLRNIKDPFERNAVFQQLVAERELDLTKKFGFQTGQLQVEIDAPQTEDVTVPKLLKQTKTETSEFDKQVKLIERKNELLTARLEGNEKEIEQKHREMDLVAEIGIFEAAKIFKLQDGTRKLQEQNRVLDRQKELFTQIGDNIATGITDALVGAIEGTRSLGEAARGILKGIASDLLRLGINTLLKNTGIGLFANLPGLANGGSAQAGRSYLVGEKGPEIFTPKSSGTVIPNNQIGGAGGGIVNNINVNVSAEGMQSNANEDRGKELGVALASAIQSELIKQKRPGGLLAT